MCTNGGNDTKLALRWEAGVRMQRMPSGAETRFRKMILLYPSFLSCETASTALPPVANIGSIVMASSSPLAGGTLA